MRRVSWWMAGALVATALTGCGGADEPGPGRARQQGPDGADVSVREAFSGPAGYSVSASLAQLPDVRPRPGARVEVSSGSLEAATAVAGFDRPTSADPDELLPWLRALNGDVGLPTSRSTGLGSVNVDPTGRALGFTAADVRSFVELRAGGTQLSVQTLYDDAEVRSDLPGSGAVRRTGPGRPGSVTRDRLLSDRFPVVHLVARAGPRVAFSTDAATLRRWRSDAVARLAARPRLAAVARALDEARVYAASLSAGSFAARGSLARGALRERFTAVGVGLTLERDRPIVRVGYYFPGDVAAGARQVQAVWKDGTSRRARVPLTDYVDLRRASTTGRVVTVELDASRTGPTAVLQMLADDDVAFTHAGSR